MSDDIRLKTSFSSLEKNAEYIRVHVSSPLHQFKVLFISVNCLLCICRPNFMTIPGHLNLGWHWSLLKQCWNYHWGMGNVSLSLKRLHGLATFIPILFEGKWPKHIHTHLRLVQGSPNSALIRPTQLRPGDCEHKFPMEISQKSL